MALPRQQTRTVAGVTYTLTRRRVRNINLRVRADGSVAASAAPRVSVMKVDAFVASKADWVRSAQARRGRPAANRKPPSSRNCPPGPRPWPISRCCAGHTIPSSRPPARRAYAQDRCAGYDYPLGQLQLKNRHVALRGGCVWHPCPRRNML